MAHHGRAHKSSYVLNNRFRFSPGWELRTNVRQRRQSVRWWSGKGRLGGWKSRVLGKLPPVMRMRDLEIEDVKYFVTTI